MYRLDTGILKGEKTKIERNVRENKDFISLRSEDKRDIFWDPLSKYFLLNKERTWERKGKVWKDKSIFCFSLCKYVTRVKHVFTKKKKKHSPLFYVFQFKQPKNIFIFHLFSIFSFFFFFHSTSFLHVYFPIQTKRGWLCRKQTCNRW